MTKTTDLTTYLPSVPARRKSLRQANADKDAEANVLAAVKAEIHGCSIDQIRAVCDTWALKLHNDLGIITPATERNAAALVAIANYLDERGANYVNTYERHLQKAIQDVRWYKASAYPSRIKKVLRAYAALELGLA